MDLGELPEHDDGDRERINCAGKGPAAEREAKLEKKRSCAVVVPVHKMWPDEWERRSFMQILRVYADRPIYLVHPQGVSMSKYMETEGAQDCREMAFPSSHYISRASYNDLLLSTGFYSAFMGYEYILIHHLDAWSFRDELDRFMALGADYIGCASTGLGERMAGGLSLRRTFSCLSACRAAGTLDGISLLLRTKYLSLRDLTAIAKRNLAIPIGKERPYHSEDHFFTFGAPILLDGFRAASREQALRFSFDRGPEMLWAECGGEAPMGCHAFYKDGNWEFWQRHIGADEVQD